MINNKEEVPFAHYEAQFRAMDPAEAVRRLQIPFDGTAFTVTMLGSAYRITHPDCAITSQDPAALALKKRPAQTFLLRYLLEGKALPASGAWKTFRELPWGEVYVQPFTGRCLNRAAFTFGGKLEALTKAGQALGAVPVDQGDVGLEVALIGDYRMRLLVWAADEEFPPSAQILYSDNFALAFTAEDRVVAADLLMGALCQYLPR